jgi:hypothetical protein
MAESQALPHRRILFACWDSPDSDAALEWFLRDIAKPGDFVQLLHGASPVPCLLERAELLLLRR